jgi:hypothetical protein
MLRVEDVDHADLGRCLRLSNGEVELVLATQIGPRILRYAKEGGRNLLGEVPRAAGSYETRFGTWYIHGGHRLWYAPEGDPRSYWPDEAPVRVDREGAQVTLTQSVEPPTQLEKSISVELADTGSDVRLVHRITNHALFDVELAPWALTVMAKGGRAIFPQVPFRPHPAALAPARPLVVWPFTRMADPRWTFGDRYLVLRQDPERSSPQKIGLYDPIGWMAYAVFGQVFVKRHDPRPGPHADFGCNVETFTNETILELETLGPLVRLAPGATVTHEERWELRAGPDAPDDAPDDEDALDALFAGWESPVPT